MLFYLNNLINVVHWIILGWLFHFNQGGGKMETNWLKTRNSWENVTTLDETAVNKTDSIDTTDTEHHFSC